MTRNDANSVFYRQAGSFTYQLSEYALILDAKRVALYIISALGPC